MKDSYGRKLFSLKEYYRIVYLAFFSANNLQVVRKNKTLSEHFMERIMLAVTEVNGCPLCSFAHTKMALESGMSNEEIQNMLAGIGDDIPDDEISAVLFSQHYAETRGYPSRKSWERIVEIYGLEKAKGILGAIRIMMLGNAFGIPLGSFLNRFKKGEEADERSGLIYEIVMILASVVYLPIALIHALLAKLFKKPTIKFKDVEKLQSI